MSVLRDSPGMTRATGRRLFVVSAVVSTLLLALPGTACARDTVIARGKPFREVMALDGIVVYHQINGSVWWRFVNGRTRVAKGMLRSTTVGDIGLDESGHVVVPILRSKRWWLYDVATDRARPVRGLPANLSDCSTLSIWRNRLAYGGGDCNSVYLRMGSRTRRVAGVSAGLRGLTLRGVALFGEFDDGSDGTYVSLLADASGVCRTRMPDGFGRGDAGSLGGWWLSRRYLTWIMGYGDPGATLVGAYVRGRCRVPGPAGLLFAPPSNMQVMAVDDRYVYYGDRDWTTILRHRLPAAPSTAPPANDDFEDATPLTGDPPLSITGVTGNATTQPGEPVFTYPARTIWYAYRPGSTRRVAIYGYSRIFTGATIDTLTPLAHVHADSSDPMIVQLWSNVFDVVAGQTYWIDVASISGFPDFTTRTVSIQPDPGFGTR